MMKDNQLTQLLQFQISNEATVVTADVDAFPMTKQIIGPLVVKSGCSIWLYRYGLTLGAGNTFMMPFIGAKSHVWRKILEYDYMPESHSDIGQGIPKWIEKYKPLLNFGPGTYCISDFTKSEDVFRLSWLKTGQDSVPEPFIGLANYTKMIMCFFQIILGKWTKKSQVVQS